MSGVTGALNMAQVYLNGCTPGCVQGTLSLPVVGYSSTYINAQLVKDGNFITLHCAGFQPGTNIESASFGVELPGLIRPANLTRTLPITCNASFYNAGSVLYGHTVHGEYESTFYKLNFQLMDINSSSNIGWTGSCGWYGYMTIAYNTLASI